MPWAFESSQLLCECLLVTAALWRESGPRHTGSPRLGYRHWEPWLCARLPVSWGGHQNFNSFSDQLGLRRPLKIAVLAAPGLRDSGSAGGVRDNACSRRQIRLTYAVWTVTWLRCVSRLGVTVWVLVPVPSYTSTWLTRPGLLPRACFSHPHRATPTRPSPWPRAHLGQLDGPFAPGPLPPARHSSSLESIIKVWPGVLLHILHINFMAKFMLA